MSLMYFILQGSEIPVFCDFLDSCKSSIFKQVNQNWHQQTVIRYYCNRSIFYSISVAIESNSQSTCILGFLQHDPVCDTVPYNHSIIQISAFLPENFHQCLIFSETSQGSDSVKNAAETGSWKIFPKEVIHFEYYLFCFRRYIFVFTGFIYAKFS